MTTDNIVNEYITGRRDSTRTTVNENSIICIIVDNPIMVHIKPLIQRLVPDVFLIERYITIPSYTMHKDDTKPCAIGIVMSNSPFSGSFPTKIEIVNILVHIVANMYEVMSSATKDIL